MEKKNSRCGCGSIIVLLAIYAFLVDVLPVAVALMVMGIIIFGIYKNASKQKILTETKEKESNRIPVNELEDSTKRKNEVISAQNFDISEKNRKIKELESELRKERRTEIAPVDGYDFPEIDGLDRCIWEASLLIIRNQKCGEGMLQRYLKIGFNRAHLIIEQLCDIGIVGEEYGTKPREVLVDEKGLKNILKDLSEKGYQIPKQKPAINSGLITPNQPERVQMYNGKIDYMTGEDFELYISQILGNIGFYNIQTTKGSGDQGVDILAEKEGMKYAFQCKRYDKPVGNKAVQEVFAGKFFYHCHVAVVVTNNYFTQSAKDLAHENGVVLWDRMFLEKYSPLGRKSNEKVQEKEENKIDANDLRNTCMIINAIILETYKNYNIYVKFADFRFEDGNAVFGVLPMTGTRVNEILGFEKELSLKLGADIKIEMISERGYIGVYMPILQFKKRMEEMLNDDRFSEYYKMCEDEQESRYDRLFSEAGRLIIEKRIASIGLIQRNFKIGFNHAEKIMNELCEAGVIREQEGTEPRKTLMNIERFEQYIDKNL